MKKRLVASKNFVSKHRVAIAVTLTSAVWLKAFANSNKGLEEFLKEHDLFDKYYTPEQV